MRGRVLGVRKRVGVGKALTGVGSDEGVKEAWALGLRAADAEVTADANFARKREGAGAGGCCVRCWW